MRELLLVVAMSGAAGLASPAGALMAVRHRPSTLFSSITLGLAGGTLLGAVAFEMLPRAQALAGIGPATGGLVAGVVAMYLFDLVVMGGEVAGAAAEQRSRTEQRYRRLRPWGDEITVLAGGTAAEEVVEGVSIGVGGAIDPGLALLVAASIALDNITEGMAIAALSVEREGAAGRARGIRWAGTIGVSLFVSAIAGWFLLRSIPDGVLGTIVGMGAGGMFYLTVTDLIPEAEARHYQHSSALAVALAFATVHVLAHHV